MADAVLGSDQCTFYVLSQQSQDSNLWRTGRWCTAALASRSQCNAWDPDVYLCILTTLG